MVASGLNKPQDMVMGNYKSTYASIKAAHGPQHDRVNDDLEYFRRFLTYNFWKPIFFLKSVVSGFKENRKVEEVIGFKGDPDSEKGLEDITKKVTKPAYKLVDIALPVSKLEDIESMAKAMLGVKHGSLVDTMNIPMEEVAQRMGFYNYKYLVKKRATERRKFPKTKAAVDQEAEQEKKEAEPKGSLEKEKPSKEKK